MVNDVDDPFLHSLDKDDYKNVTADDLKLWDKKYNQPASDFP